MFPRADSEWSSGVQLAPDGAEDNVPRLSTKFQLQGNITVDGHGQGYVGGLALHCVPDTRLHGLLPELFVLSIVLGAFGTVRSVRNQRRTPP